MRQIILASTSPRRKELMKFLGLPFKVVASNYREVHHKHLKPEQLVTFLAEGKARAVAKKYKNAIVIGADTIVLHKGKIFGKPKNKAEARKMLWELNNSRHEVITGLCVFDAKTGKKYLGKVTLKVYFRNLTSRVINSYVSIGEPLDKAGAYAVQGHGMGLIKKVEGELTNGIGLPLETLLLLLKKFGIHPKKQ